jgi:hypothetical protein
VPIVRDERFHKTLINSFEAHFEALSFVNSNTWHLICNNFNLNFIFDIVYLFVCVYAFSLRRESPDMILGDKPLISEVVLSQAESTLELPGYIYLTRGKRIISSQPYCYRQSKPWATVDELSQLTLKSILEKLSVQSNQIKNNSSLGVAIARRRGRERMRAGPQETG